MDKDFMLTYYDKMVRPIWTELMKTLAISEQLANMTSSNVSSGDCWMKN